MLKTLSSALTDMADPIAEPEERADRFGIGLLHEQFNDGLPVGVNKILALSRERGGQNITDFLHSLHNLFLKFTTNGNNFNRRILYTYRFIAM